MTEFMTYWNKNVKIVNEGATREKIPKSPDNEKPLFTRRKGMQMNELTVIVWQEDDSKVGS